MKFGRQNITRGTLAFMISFLVLLPQSFLSCSVETAGESISFRAAVVGATDGGTVETFDTTTGWSVSITSAHAVFGPIYYYGGDPMAQANLPMRLVGGAAMACPSHAQYDYGAVLGEVLEQYVVDLLATEPTFTGEVSGEAGTCHSVELHLHPPGDQYLQAGSASATFDQLDGYTVVIEGMAISDTDTVPFRAALDVPDEGTMRIVQNIAADVEFEDMSDRPGSIVVEVLLDAWFDHVDFMSLTQTDDDGNYLFSEDVQGTTALLEGIRNRYSYNVDWRKQ